MSILSDVSLYDIIVNHKQMIVNPFNEKDLQPNSIDLHLDSKLLTLHGKSIDISEQGYKLKPNEFLLGSTIEKISVPVDLTARVDGKSSLGRLGVMVHSTAGMVDAGFMGNITLEIKNISDKTFELNEGETICQILFETLTTPVKKPYGHPDHNNHYQNSDGVVGSKYE